LPIHRNPEPQKDGRDQRRTVWHMWVAVDSHGRQKKEENSKQEIRNKFKIRNSKRLNGLSSSFPSSSLGTHSPRSFASQITSFTSPALRLEKVDKNRPWMTKQSLVSSVFPSRSLGTRSTATQMDLVTQPLMAALPRSFEFSPRYREGFKLLDPFRNAAFLKIDRLFCSGQLPQVTDSDGGHRESWVEF